VGFAADKKQQLMLVVTTAGRPGAILDGVKASTTVGGAVEGDHRMRLALLLLSATMYQ
jgi:hypothetical protein